MKRGKRYQEAAKLRDKTNLYDAPEAVAIVKKAASANFDETIEAHFKMGLDGRHADQQIRGAVVLPNGTGKKGLTPGPIVEVSVALLMYCPLAAAGFALMMASINVWKFSFNCSSVKEAFPIGT